MIAHAAQWLLQGATLSPVEPSEGMEFAKHGIVNTGLVFFVAAIAVTVGFSAAGAVTSSRSRISADGC